MHSKAYCSPFSSERKETVGSSPDPLGWICSVHSINPDYLARVKPYVQGQSVLLEIIINDYDN